MAEKRLPEEEGGRLSVESVGKAGSVASGSMLLSVLMLQTTEGEQDVARSIRTDLVGGIVE
jgi:hypothetical protein